MLKKLLLFTAVFGLAQIYGMDNDDGKPFNLPRLGGFQDNNIYCFGCNKLIKYRDIIRDSGFPLSVHSIKCFEEFVEKEEMEPKLTAPETSLDIKKLRHQLEEAKKKEQESGKN